MGQAWIETFSKCQCPADEFFSLWQLSLLQRAVLWEHHQFIRRLFCSDKYGVDINLNIAKPVENPYTILDWVDDYFENPNNFGGSSHQEKVKSIRDNILIPCGAKRWKDLTPEEQEEMRNGN